MSDEVECFFCGEPFPRQIFTGKKGFTCLSCENYNGFDPESQTGYNRPIPEMFDVNLNPRKNFARETECSHLPKRVFCDPFEFCPTCQRAQNRNPSKFRTCSECRLKVVAHLRRLDSRTEDVYGVSSYENAVGQSFGRGDKRKSSKKMRRKYGFFEKFFARCLHYCIMSLVPVQVIYLCLLNYQMVIGVTAFGWWENILWKLILFAICPLFLRGFMFPFLMLLCVGWSPRFVKWMCRDKQVWCGGNEEIFALAVGLCLTIFKIVKDEVKRVKVCSQLETSQERRQCYLYSNLFNEEDGKKKMSSFTSSTIEQDDGDDDDDDIDDNKVDEQTIKKNGIVDMNEIKKKERRSKKSDRRERYSNVLLLPRKKRTITGFIVSCCRNSNFIRSFSIFLLSLSLSLGGLIILEYLLNTNLIGIDFKRFL